MQRFLQAVPKVAVTALIVLAIVNLLVGVILRYFVGAITDWLDVDPVPFTWVEEVGELSLAWLYASAVVGGILIAIYGLAEIISPPGGAQVH